VSAIPRIVAELAAIAPTRAEDPSRRQAAVALVLAPNPDSVLLIRRAERESDPWSGHLALPGGRRDPGDADLLDTAIRETWEETGLQLRREWCGAVLDDLSPRPTALPAMSVRPFVFSLKTALAAGVSAEVAHAAWVPIATMLRDGVYQSVAIESRGTHVTACGYQLDEGFLWGMTERIITPVLRRFGGLTFG